MIVVTYARLFGNTYILVNYRTGLKPQFVASAVLGLSFVFMVAISSFGIDLALVVPFSIVFIQAMSIVGRLRALGDSPELVLGTGGIESEAVQGAGRWLVLASESMLLGLKIVVLVSTILLFLKMVVAW